MLHIIVNEMSRTGKAKEIWKICADELERRKVSYKTYKTRHVGHAKMLARQITSGKEDVIYLIVLGGDGTIGDVLNGIVNFEKVRLGVIPTGSGNDFGRGLRISDGPIEILSDILFSIQRENMGVVCPKIDLGRVIWQNGEKSRIFGISAGVGLDAIVCKKAGKTSLKTTMNRFHIGNLTYILLTIFSLFKMDTTDIVIKAEKEYKLKKCIFLSAMNFPWEGGGVPMAPSASATDGKISVTSASGIPKWKTFVCLPKLLAAKQDQIKGFTFLKEEQFTITSNRPVALHTDGEYCGILMEAKVECLKQKLYILNGYGQKKRG